MGMSRDLVNDQPQQNKIRVGVFVAFAWWKTRRFVVNILQVPRRRPAASTIQNGVTQDPPRVIIEIVNSTPMLEQVLHRDPVAIRNTIGNRLGKVIRNNRI